MISMQNLALNKPALQSSTSEWSRDREIAQDAKGGNDGNITKDLGFHTATEREPWWQVDLEGDFLIKKVLIYNRRTKAEHLKHFSILFSTDGQDWRVAYRKYDITVFGQNDDLPYVAEIRTRHICRYVRIRLDGFDCLHFRQCEVFGEPITPTLRKDILDELRSREASRIQIPAGRNGEIVKVDGFSLFVDHERYDDEIITALRTGSYESRERDLVKSFVQPNDRVLEVGTAIGLVAMTAAAIVGPQNVLSYDANPEIVEDARQNFQRNGLNDIQSHIGVLKNSALYNNAQVTTEFFIASAFWASRINPAEVQRMAMRRVEVPVFCLEQVIQSHGANVLVCDIEGGEVELLRQANLSSIRCLILETHYWSAGETATDEMIRDLAINGYFIHLEYSRQNVIVLRKTT